jgi:hypothetical protein
VANKILAFFEAEVEPTVSLASIANGAGRISALIDNTTVRAARGILAVKVKTGTSPTVNTAVRYYLIRQSAATSVVKGGGGGLGDSDAGVSAEPTLAPVVGSIIVSSSSNVSYSELFTVNEPGEKFSIVVWNATGASLNATPDTPSLQWTPITDEVQ